MDEIIEAIKTKAESGQFNFNYSEDDPEDWGIFFEIELSKDDVVGRRWSIIFGTYDNNGELKHPEPFRAIADSSIDRFDWVSDYYAIHSVEDGIVECGLRYAHPRQTKIQEYQFSDLKKMLGGAEGDDRITLPAPSDDISITIGKSSVEYDVLGGVAIRPKDGFGRDHTLRIEGLDVLTPGQAKDAMLSIGNSVLFQIEQKTEVCIHPAFQFGGGVKTDRRPDIVDEVNIDPPKYEYGNEPMALFWFARGVWNAPTIQYLAYYQIIEYYYPRYTTADAQRAIQNVVKAPTFDANRPSSVQELLSALRKSAWGTGREKDMLGATLKQCVSVEQLRAFLTQDGERLNFIQSREGQNLAGSNHRINPGQGDEDLWRSVYDRVYNLRCRIVHAKGSGYDTDPLVPYSSEVRLMQYDIELVRFLATKVIIASAESLKHRG
jgi:hypothetical protein